MQEKCGGGFGAGRTGFAMGEEGKETGVGSSRFVGKGSCEIFSAGSGMFACAIAEGPTTRAMKTTRLLANRPFMGDPSGRTKVVFGRRFPRISKLSFRMAIHWPLEWRIGAMQGGGGYCEEVLSFEAVTFVARGNLGLVCRFLRADWH